MKKKVLFAVVGSAVLLTAVVLVRTLTFHSRQLHPAPFEPIALDKEQLAQRLAGAIQCKTISHEAGPLPADEFRKLHAFLEEAFPNVHAKLTRETVGDYSLLYTWPGIQPDRKPVLFLAHMDVVSADAADQWTHPPFADHIADGYIWGRGAVDDKACVLGVLEAVEALLRAKFQPARTIHLAFGHDEELGGTDGAKRIAALLKSRGVQAAFSLDEGLAITDGIVPGMTQPLALVGTAEKGYLNLELTVKQQGGHSSQPPKQTAIGILAAAVTRLDKHPMPAKLQGPVRRMFDYAGPEMSFFNKTLLANQWLFSRLIKRELEASPATNAGLRTTAAATVIQGGIKENVLPARARAVVNFRLLPGDTPDAVITHVRRVVDDPRVEIKRLPGANQASPVSNDESPGFVAVATSIRQVWPDVVVAPSLDIAATDSKHYAEIAQDLFRFTPLWFRDEDLAMIHGPNERVPIDRYLQAVQFYVQVIRNAASDAG